MLTIQREAWEKCGPEILQLADAYWAEVRGAMENPKITLNETMYRTYEAQGALVIMTCRDGDALVGFAIFVVMTHHHHETRCGVADAWYVCPHRREGLLGLRLLREMEEQLEALGCTHVYAGMSAQKDVSAILARRHYTPVETMYCKMLGDA